MPHAFDLGVLAGQLKRDLLFVSRRTKLLENLLGKLIQIDSLTRELGRVFVQPRELDDIIDKVDEAERFAVDIAGKLAHLLHRHKTLFHQLGKH